MCVHVFASVCVWVGGGGGWRACACVKKAFDLVDACVCAYVHA
jgi:hypothetical protein